MRAVRLSDVADVSDGVENVRNIGIANGKPAILINVTKQPGANVIDVVDSIRALMPELQAALPAAIDLSVINDPTVSIRNAVRDVEETLVLSTILVVVVVFFFLRNLRATLVPAVSVPLSLLGTFGMMYLLGFSLDNFSLMALIVSTGFVVDNTIVVLENVTRHLELGESRMQAALQGRAGSHLHRAVHEHFAGGGVFPHPAAGRHRGQHLPRIRRDPDHRHRHVADRFAQRHADDVRLSRHQPQ